MLLMRGVLDRLAADDRPRIVDRQIDGENVADRSLTDEALLRRDADARLRRRVIEPQRMAVEERHLSGVTRRVDILDQVAELPRRRVFLGEDDQDVLGARLAADIFGERAGEAEGRARV